MNDFGLFFEKTEKSYHVPLLMILRSIFGNQVKGDEVQATGRADIILNLENYVYILELKVDGNADDAIAQIHEKKYYTPYEIEENKFIELLESIFLAMYGMLQIIDIKD